MKEEDILKHVAVSIKEKVLKCDTLAFFNTKEFNQCIRDIIIECNDKFKETNSCSVIHYFYAPKGDSIVKIRLVLVSRDKASLIKKVKAYMLDIYSLYGKLHCEIWEWRNDLLCKEV